MRGLAFCLSRKRSNPCGFCFTIHYIFILSTNYTMHDITLKIATTDIRDNCYYPLHAVNSRFPPLVGYNYKPSKNYTIIMIDKDSVNPQIPTTSYVLLHWLVINNSIVINEYWHPDPRNFKIHTYEFLIYTQSKPLTITTPVIRENFCLTQFAEEHGLKLVASIQFQTSKLPH
jgi:phosphatidylethanolamine-binding protein (PEBP) family uncharacterized protein